MHCMSWSVDIDKKPFTTLQIWVSFHWGETSLIICESACSLCACTCAYVCVCVCTCGRGVHVLDNNKASENEEELNCVSHFSFPCFSACQKKALHFEWWLRQQKVNNKPCGSEERNGGRKSKKEGTEESKKDRMIQACKYQWRIHRFFFLKKRPKQQTNKAKSQYQSLNNTTGHALKVKHNREKNYLYSWHSYSFGRTFQGADLMWEHQSFSSTGPWQQVKVISSLLMGLFTLDPRPLVFHNSSFILQT